MTSINVYKPEFEVRLVKMIKRKDVDGVTPTSERFQGTQKVIDLAPWLSDSTNISTFKSIHEGAGGFALTLPDKPYGDARGLDSLYGIIEPMDLIEIRARHGVASGSAQGRKPPVVMRGFVSKVGRRELMQPNGQPSRSVVVVGQDYGKIWQMLQIFYGPSYIIGEDILSNFKLMDRFGAGLNNALTNIDFLKLGVQMVNQYLAKILPEGAEFPSITVHAEGVKEASVGITGVQSAEGSIYTLMRRYLDTGPFNELFLTEDDNGVYCVYRQNPAIGLSGQVLDRKVTAAPLPARDGLPASQLVIVNIPAKDIVEISVDRSDSNVANYYWVSAPSFSLNSDVLQRQMGASVEERKTTDLGSYGNCSVDLYGNRLMMIETKLGGPNVRNVKSGLSEQEHYVRDGNVFDWIKDRREFLVAQNKDNSVLEQGTIQVRGNEKIRVGNYVQVMRGDTSSLYYVVAVAHQMLPFRGFFTTLTVARGLGFADRVTKGGGVASPYLAELAER
ncbi:hypothetical protein [Pseudomonas fluorescens]|uniref:hypothetical protein n=1 Tax=Pseudomonas fluorescens TaxID=294 RepID=UPI0020C329CE|nr:hypothetical protein [Pseudomonas fluorescens]UTL90702.1 hypothetical protein NLL86_25275 [Pseudomonas fluorescens]